MDTTYTPDQQKLLDNAIQSHYDYLEGVKELKRRRRNAFRLAIHGRVKNIDIATGVNLSTRSVSVITKGE